MGILHRRILARSFGPRNALNFTLDAHLNVLNQGLKLLTALFDSRAFFVFRKQRTVNAIYNVVECIVIIPVLGRPVMAIRETAIIQLF